MGSSLLNPPPGRSIGGRHVKGVFECVAGGPEGLAQGVLLVVGLARCSWGGVQAPLGLQRSVHLLWCGELEDASLFGDDGALVLWGKSRHKLGDKLADLLWVQVTDFLRHVNKRREDLVMALLWTFLKGASSSTDLNRKFLTTGVSNKLAGLLLHILGCAGGLVDSLANFFSLSIANLLCWLVALPHCLVEGLLLEGDRAGLLKVLLAHFLLRGGKFGDIGVVALLRVLVGALKDRVLLQGGHSLLLVNAAQPGLRILLTAAEVDASLDLALLATSSR